MAKYRMLKDSKLEAKATAGTVVYPLIYHDYGSAGDDQRAFGYECKSMTLKENGDYPYFVVPFHDLERIDE